MSFLDHHSSQDTRQAIRTCGRSQMNGQDQRYQPLNPSPSPINRERNKGLRVTKYIHTQKLTHSPSTFSDIFYFHIPLPKLPTYSHAGGAAGPQPPSGVVLQNPTSSHTTTKPCTAEEGPERKMELSVTNFN